MLFGLTDWITNGKVETLLDEPFDSVCVSHGTVNALLAQAAEGEDAELINLATLRAMQQAYYHPENFGHFGLALRAYAHFTSPIRRYADLVVHRALIGAHGWGDDGLSPEDVAGLERTAKHISETERRSMAAARDTTDRYLASFLADRVGAEFAGRITGVQRFGVFVALEDTGADGLVPVREIGREFFRYDEKSQTLMGDRTGLELSVGQPVTVRLAEADAVTGGIRLELLEVDGNAMPQGGRRDGRFVSRLQRSLATSNDCFIVQDLGTETDRLRSNIDSKHVPFLFGQQIAHCGGFPYSSSGRCCRS